MNKRNQFMLFQQLNKNSLTIAFFVFHNLQFIFQNFEFNYTWYINTKTFVRCEF